ncbi:MAG: hypothetical protein J6Q53_00810 [Oscillospiraceae bacterium]|nr:hypothetical protein [Oscillospiraceae bacterium]
MKAGAAVLVTAALYLVLSKRDRDISMLLTVVVCCMVLGAALTYLEPVFTLFRRLQDLSSMDPEVFGILLKSVGIGLLGEIVALICTDIGNAALGKSLQILAIAVIMWLSIPLLTSLLDLVGNILSKA